MINELLMSFDSLVDKFFISIPKLIFALVLFLVSLLIAYLVRRALRAALTRSKIDQQASNMLSGLSYWAIIILGGVTALSQLGVNVSALIAGLGIVGFTIGFALQDVGRNFIAGLLIIIQKPFSVGEQIEVSGFTGTVIEIGMRATVIRALDGKIVTIPSSDVFTRPIVNLTRAVHRKVEIGLLVDYQNDLNHVNQVALKALETQAGILPEPAPQMDFNVLSPAAVQAHLSYWIDPALTNILTSKDSTLQAVKEAFAHEGIQIPPSVD